METELKIILFYNAAIGYYLYNLLNTRSSTVTQGVYEYFAKSINDTLE